MRIAENTLVIAVSQSGETASTALGGMGIRPLVLAVRGAISPPQDSPPHDL